MPAMKPLRSVAHNLAHQFASSLNYWTDDYAIAYLAKAATAEHAESVVIDVLAQTTKPSSVQQGVVAEIVPTLRAALFELLRKEGFAPETIAAASLAFTFGARPGNAWLGMPTYECVSTLETIDGRKYEAHLTEQNG